LKFKLGDKVIPIKKTSRKREIDNCASYYKRIELNQNFLYVNGVDEGASKHFNETCYWCDAVKGMGDSYKESDLIPYNR
jgi:hypothetical protein